MREVSERVPRHGNDFTRSLRVTSMRRRALLAGVAAGTTALAGCIDGGSPFGDQAQESREYEFDLPSDAPVRVMGENGDVAVETGDRTGVAVDARVAAPSESRLDDVTVTTSTVEGALAVDVDVEGDTSGVSVDLDVEVPAGTAMAVVQTENGDVDVAGVAGVEAARSSNGDVTVRNAGPVESVSTENGDIGADVPAPLAGDVLLRTENGDVDASLSPDIDAVVDAQTTNGDVEVEYLDLQNRSEEDTHVTGTLGDGTHDVTIGATNGDVVVRALQ